MTPVYEVDPFPFLSEPSPKYWAEVTRDETCTPFKWSATIYTDTEHAGRYGSEYRGQPGRWVVAFMDDGLTSLGVHLWAWAKLRRVRRRGVTRTTTFR